MDAERFFTASTTLIVAGKGGVGKTTVAASLGLAASRAGVRTLVVEVEGKQGLAKLFGVDDMQYEDAPLADDLWGRSLRADDALVEYLDDKGLRRFAKTLGRLQVLDTLATSTPGIRDLIVLGKIKQLEREADCDLVIVDAPASGHAITFLRSARGLLDAISTGPIHGQAMEVDALLTDPERCRTVLVTLPEETPVNEVVQTAYRLEDEIGIKLGPVVVNSLWPELPEEAASCDAVDFYRTRERQQRRQVERLERELPLPQILLPFVFTVELGRADLDRLAEAASAAIEEMR